MPTSLQPRSVTNVSLATILWTPSVCFTGGRRPYGVSESWVTFSLRRKAQHAKVFATFLCLPKVELNLLIQPTFRTRTKR